jgi:F-type H+-transporting ATPase subunit b
MEDTLNALGQILLQALPTFVLVLLLHFYLKQVFFKPLERVLHERTEATEGARKAAAESLERADAKAAAYEQSIRSARNDIYREQEQIRRQWLDEQSAQLQNARRRTEAMVVEAKAQIAAEAAQAKESLNAATQSLANEITAGILEMQRRPV